MAKPIRRKKRRRKSGSRSPSGLAGTAPRRRAFRFGLRVVLVAVSRRVLGCGARQRGALVYAKHTPRLQKLFITYCLAFSDDFGIGNYFDLRRGIGLPLMLKYVKII